LILSADLKKGGFIVIQLTREDLSFNDITTYSEGVKLLKIYYIDEAKRLYACSDASKDGWGFIIFQLTREDLSFDDITVDSEGVKLQGRKLIATNIGSFNKVRNNVLGLLLIKNVMLLIEVLWITNTYYMVIYSI